MATNVLNRPAADDADKPYTPLRDTLVYVLESLASLRLTVALFAMAIFLIFAGTLAQVDKDILEVMHTYFRTFVAKIELQVFFPDSFFPGRPVVPGWFPFPGGWLIGGAMLVNLLAAHGLRFKVQAKGSRLAAGLAVTALGIFFTWLVIMGGSGKETIEGGSLNTAGLWLMIKLGVVALWIASSYGFYRLAGTRRIERWLLGFATVGLGALVVWLLASGFSLGGSSMRILWQLYAASGAAAVLLVGCALLFKKRAGIVLLHAGVGLMMANELVVHSLHVENQMYIVEGDTVNFVHDIRSLELAVADLSDPKYEQGVVIPKSLLTGTVRDPLLPFDVRMVRFFQNAEFRDPAPGEHNPATAGFGLRKIAHEVDASTGTDSDSEVDSSAAYVKLTDKSGKDLGTYLVSVRLFPQPIEVDSHKYDLTLRYKRSHRPYSVHLTDVRADMYPGTKTPKNYSSDVRIVDRGHNVDREVKIWMNNPLRYSGETFYQSNYHLDPVSGQEATTLQVVKNTGWMIPYVACVIVAFGMVSQFLLTLLRFLDRVNRTETDKKTRKESPVRRWLAPAIVLMFCAPWVASKAIPPRTPYGAMDLVKFGKLPLVYEGRVKPFDTLARNSLVIVSDRQTFIPPAEEDKWFPKSASATQWLLDLITDTPDKFTSKVIRIENLEVLHLLGLEPRSGLRYSIDEVSKKGAAFLKQVELANQAKPDSASVYQRKILELDRRQRELGLLVGSFDRPDIRPETAKEDLTKAFRQQEALAEVNPPLVIASQDDQEKWEPYTSAWTKAFVQAQVFGQAPNPVTVAFDQILVAYRKHDAREFNRAVDKYAELISSRTPTGSSAKRTNFEVFFNQFAPFYHALVLYVIAFVVGCLAWLGWTRPLSRASTALILLALVVHTFALLARIYISQRPPVFNLYSSAVFIGWAAVVLGLVLEAIYRLNIGNIVASVAGFATLVIAHFLSIKGDTFMVLQAVLDTQFWLATHVVCITLGYATTYVAGLLGVIYVLGGVLTPSFSPKVSKDLSRMIYGKVCFAIFFSFVGTVLGGLWADDSWGRFWGWDPKENGALMIVLWNALVLHARWGGIVGERGLAVLAVAGNIVVSWSWFGVNELGKGLHSYGFTDGVLLSLGLFVASQLAVIGLGSLPKRLWWSQRELQAG